MFYREIVLGSSELPPELKLKVKCNHWVGLSLKCAAEETGCSCCAHLTQAKPPSATSLHLWAYLLFSQWVWGWGGYGSMVGWRKDDRDTLLCFPHNYCIWIETCVWSLIVPHNIVASFPVGINMIKRQLSGFLCYNLKISKAQGIHSFFPLIWRKADGAQ